MSSNIEEAVVENLRALPPEQQQQVLEFVEELKERSKYAETQDVNSLPIWEVIRRVTAEVPDEEWEKLPRDGAEQHDHYLYGSPKK